MLIGKHPLDKAYRLCMDRSELASASQGEALRRWEHAYRQSPSPRPLCIPPLDPGTLGTIEAISGLSDNASPFDLLHFADGHRHDDSIRQWLLRDHVPLSYFSVEGRRAKKLIYTEIGLQRQGHYRMFKTPPYILKPQQYRSRSSKKELMPNQSPHEDRTKVKQGRSDDEI